MKKLAIAAAALLVAYGFVRLADGLDGEHGPGVAWTVGHVLFLAGFVLFGVLVLRIPRLLTRRRALAVGAAVVGMTGVLAFIRVIVVDLLVGFRAADNASMSRIGDEYERWPGNLGIYEPLYDFGPLLFLAGLLTLTILLTVEHHLAVWAPIAVLAGFVAIAANLNLMSLGGALLGAGLGSAQRTRSSHRVP